MDAIIDSARAIIIQAKEGRAWKLSENEYELLLSYNEQVAQFGTATQRARYLGLLQWGRYSTEDKTPAHGIFNALLIDWQNCYELVYQSNFIATPSVGVAA